jgi:chromosomal replication initiation ATPase DnaA
MYVLRKNAGLTLNRVGILFHRDHGAVYHAQKTVENRISVDPKAKADVLHLLHATRPLTSPLSPRPSK